MKLLQGLSRKNEVIFTKVFTKYEVFANYLGKSQWLKSNKKTKTKSREK